MCPTLSYDQYREKVLAGWIGKSIGGVIGARLENHKEFKTLTMDTLWPDDVVPNDDLDIQLVWLEAMQERGLFLTSNDLVDFWQDRCWYNFCEYGFFLYNVQRGIFPPLSGIWNNDFFWESEGCPIRSEIWGFVSPGNPELAAALAKSDGQLDHGGVSVEIECFLAAAAAQAFVTDKLDDVLSAALSVVPADSPVATSVSEVRRICHSHFDHYRAWRAVIREYGDRDASKAITNHALVLLALFLGQLDFEKTILLCANSGWDTDCTAATAGALLGVIHGTRALPAEWVAKLGPELVCGIDVRHKNTPLTDLAEETCLIGVEMAMARNPKINLNQAPEIAVRSMPRPDISIKIDYPEDPVLWSAKPTTVHLVVENPTHVRTEGSLEIVSPASVHCDLSKSQWSVPSGSRQLVSAKIQCLEPDGWLADKNLFEVRWVEDGKVRAQRMFGLGGARQWQVYGPYWDMWDRNQHPICPYRNDQIICHPGQVGHSADSYNQYALLDHSYLDEPRLLQEDIPEEMPVYMEWGKDLITEVNLRGFRGQACYYFVRTIRASASVPKARLSIGSTGPYRLWIDGNEIGASTEIRGWAPYQGQGFPLDLTGEPQRLVLKSVRLMDAMSLSVLFQGKGDPELKRGISNLLDCLEDLVPA
jgi:ADP-ribosylglycohydrolase